VSVNFLNDAYGGTVTTDRNLYLTQANIDDVAVPSASLVLAGAGAQSFSFVVPSGAPAAPINLGSGPDVVALSVSEDAYLGDAQFTVSIDGVQFGDTQTATASHAAGASQLFNLAGTFGAGPHSVSVNFLNDAYGGAGADCNLFVIPATLNGAAIGGASLTLFSAGAQSFSFTGAGTAPPPPTGSDAFVVDGAQTGPGFYVAVGGSDSNNGSLGSPFASLARAVQAMEGSTLHTTSLRGGSYGLNSTLTLTGADSGFTIAG